MTDKKRDAPRQEDAPNHRTDALTVPHGLAAVPDVAGIVRSALAMVERGWYVFPVDHPSLPTCAGAHLKSHKSETCKRGKCMAVDWPRESSANPAVVQAMFSGPPRNIGIDCGKSGLLIVDEDVPGLLTEHAASIGETVLATFTVRTGRPGGGSHYLYRQPAGITVRCARGTLPKGIDVKGDGGYIVGPGSMHASGAFYLAADWVAPTSDASLWLVKAVTTAPVAASVAVDGEPLDGPLPDWLETLLGDDPAADRSAKFHHIVCAMRESRMFTQGQAVTVMAPWCDEHGKFVGRVPGQVAASWGKASPEPGWWQRMGGEAVAARAPVAQQGTGDGATALTGAGDGAEASAAATTPEPAAFFDKLDGLRAAMLTRLVHAAGPLTADHTGGLYRYDDGVWLPDGERVIRERVIRLLGDMYRMAHAATVVDIVRNLPPRFEALGEDTHYLNLPGGLLDWRTEQLYGHSSEVPSTVRIPVDWQPDATCPAIDAWMGQVFPGDAIGFVEEVIGYCLLNDNPLHKAVLLFGRGRNGKGTFLRLLRALIGHRNVSAVTPQSLDDNRFRAAELYGKLANLVGDVDPRIFKATETFKQITGGDAVTAERKYGQPFTFTCRALMVAAFNALPRSADTSEGFFSRWLVVPFTGYFPAGDADTSLDDKLCDAAELRGLLVLAVRGLRRLMARGCFQPPASVEKETATFRRVADPVRSFLDEYVTTLTDPWVARTHVYATYQNWSAKNGHYVMAAAAFYERMEAAGTDHATHTIHAERKHPGVRGFAFTPRQAKP